MFRKRKSILFLTPNYHNTFFQRDELRKLGWKADIYVPRYFPAQYLYSLHDVMWGPKLKKGGKVKSYINTLILFLVFIKLCLQYKHHMYYGRLTIFRFFEEQLGLNKFFGKGFNVCLSLAKLLGVKISYIGSGCNDEETREKYLSIDKGNICNNCGSFDRCDDNKNIEHFYAVRRYSVFNTGFGFRDSSEYQMRHYKWRSIDLKLWHPQLSIPDEFLLPKSSCVRVFHAFGSAGRNFEGRNIKGSPYVVTAIERLQREGYDVELVYRDKDHISEVKYTQVQADIVVDQLIAGAYGSAASEALCLGKPVVGYINPEWRKFFLDNFSEYDELPIIQADTQTIYQVLKQLLDDEEYRISMGEKARNFAQQHFNMQSNMLELQKELLNI